MDCCEICGATEDLYEYDRQGTRPIMCCSIGKCGMELQRDERDQAETAYQQDLDALNERHGLRF